MMQATPIARHGGRMGAAALLGLLLLAGLCLAWLTRDAPVEPGRFGGLLRADALSALTLLVAAGHGLVAVALGARAPWRTALAAGLIAVATLLGHLGALAALLLAAAALLGWASSTGGNPGEQLLGHTLAALPTALGLALVGAVGGEWRYGAPGAGLGLNGASLGLLLVGALLAHGAGGLLTKRAPRVEPLLGLTAIYGLLRLFSLGPWNLGWLFAALLVGSAVTLWAAWQAAGAEPAAGWPWLALVLGGLAVAAAGLASGAGVVLAGYLLLLGPVLRLGLERAEPARANWLLSAAVPVSGPFVAAWMAVAAALAGGVTVVAAAIWAAALLAALPAARLGMAGGEPLWRGPRRLLVAATLSAALGLAAPLVVAGLLRAVAAQLRGGLTPFGEIELWPWAGLIALDATRQPVATLPSLALAALMLILAALCRVVLSLWSARAVPPTPTDGPERAERLDG